MADRAANLIGLIATVAIFGPQWAASEDVLLMDGSDITLALALVCLPVGWLLLASAWATLALTAGLTIPRTVRRAPRVRIGASLHCCSRVAPRRGPPRALAV
jgi:hypothetical protein